MAVDYLGRVIAYQDFFTTTNRIMVVDVPIKGVCVTLPLPLPSREGYLWIDHLKEAKLPFYAARES